MTSADRIGMRDVSPAVRRGLVLTMAGLATATLITPLVPTAAAALDPEVATTSGVVFKDANNNGTQDTDEPGIEGVSVSDGVKTVATDKQGRYTLSIDVARRATDIVFITKPAGYEVPTDEAKTPQFYRVLGKLADGVQSKADFPLVPSSKGENGKLAFANVADTHVTPDLADQMRQINSTAQDLAFVQVSGDLTNNATDAQFQQYRASTAASKLPVWPAVGNHEYFNGGEPTYAARIDNYRRYVGPEWYSFDYGDRHFVVLENIGGAPIEEQREWLRQDLETHAKGKHVVVLTHAPMNVPFGAPSTYDSFSELLEKYKTELVLVGHEHSNDVDESVVKGAKHIQTNSSSYTIDHSPRGFRYVNMWGNGFDNPFRMYGVEKSLAVTSPAPGASVSAKGLDEIQVNAYHTSDKVESARYRVDGGEWQSMKKSGEFTWYAKYPTLAKEVGEHTLDVEAVAEGGARWQKSSTFQLTDAAPVKVEPGADWAQFHGDASHSGVASDVVRPDLELAWTYRTPGTILTGSPAIVGGVGYVGTRDENDLKNNRVHAVDLKTGNALWSARTDASVHGSPAVSDGLVFVPTINGTLYAFDAVTGKERWRREPEAAEPDQQRSYSYYSPTVAEGKVFWPYQTRYGKASRGLLAALDPKTGKAIWESPMAGSTMSDGTPAVADGKVYVGNQTADMLLAYDAATGKQLWTANAALGGWQDGAPTAAGGRVFIGSNNGVIARDAETGKTLWTYRSTGSSYIPGNATPSAPAVVGDTMYMGFPDGRVTALDTATGTVKWNATMPGKKYLGGVLSAPAVSGDTVYIGSNNGILYGLNRLTGETVWNYEIGTWVASAPAISGNTLFAGAWDGNLYAFATKK
ncbi:outer membrane protein assembly factor BamB family protein [Streptomyces sp. NPDC000880]